MLAVRPSQGELSRHLSLVADMCIHYGVPVNAVLAELRRQLGMQIDAREGLSIAEASRLCDVSKKTISNWLRDARVKSPDRGDMVFSKLEFLGQVCDFCRDHPRAINEIQCRADEAGWRFGSEARELRRILAELVEVGALLRDGRGRYRAALGLNDAGNIRWTPPDDLERYRQQAGLLTLASSKESPIPRIHRFRTTLHFQVADVEGAIAGVREHLVDEMVGDLRSWNTGRRGPEGARTLGILVAAAPTIPPSLNSMLADQERMNLLNSACEATSPFPRSQRSIRVLYARFRDLSSGVLYARERLVDVVSRRLSGSVDEEGEDWLGVTIAAVPIESPTQENGS